MAILERDPNEKLVIDLDGPAGNAFAILGLAQDLGKKLGWDKSEIESVIAEMTSGDYENLITVFDDNFGDYVDLIRSPRTEVLDKESNEKSASPSRRMR